MGKVKKVIMLVLVLLILVLSSWASGTREVPCDKQSIIQEVLEAR
jgi:hypothetical protein